MNRPTAKTWAQVTRDSEAIDDITAVLTRYLPEESGITAKEALSLIIGVVERQTGRQLLQAPEVTNGPAGHQGGQ